jgi:hypothetical protein
MWLSPFTVFVQVIPFRRSYPIKNSHSILGNFLFYISKPAKLSLQHLNLNELVGPIEAESQAEEVYSNAWERELC